MEQLPDDILFIIALNLDLPEILELCTVSSKLNAKICSNDIFWIKRLQQDYDIYYYKLFPDREYSPKTVYEYYEIVLYTLIEDLPQIYWPLYIKLMLQKRLKDTLYVKLMLQKRLKDTLKDTFTDNKTYYVVYTSAGYDITYFDDSTTAIDYIIHMAGYDYSPERLPFVNINEVNEMYGVKSQEEYVSKLSNIFSPIDVKNFIVYEQIYDGREEIYILAKVRFSS